MISSSYTPVLGALAFFGAVSSLSSQITFSTDAPSSVLHAPADLVGPGPVMILKGSSLGVEVDAFSYGRSPFFLEFGISHLFFSVTPGSAGVPGSAVSIEALKGGDEPADVYGSAVGSGTNFQAWDGDGSSAPFLGLPEPFMANVDALDMRPGIPFGVGTGIYWSIDPGSMALVPYSGGGGTAADIWFSPPVPDFADFPAVYAFAGALGLAPGDDINALVVYDDGSAGFSMATDVVFLSLATGSPTLGTLGVGPEDILMVGGGSPLGLAIMGGAIGLGPGDDLNALDFEAIPEPALMAFLVGFLALTRGVGRRRG